MRPIEVKSRGQVDWRLGRIFEILIFFHNPPTDCDESPGETPLMRALTCSAETSVAYWVLAAGDKTGEDGFTQIAG